MGRLRCDVSVLSFSDLFVHLFNSGKSGILTVYQGAMKKSFYVNSEGVSLLATTGQARSMGEMLLRTRKITRAQLDQLLDEKAISGRRLAELVHGRGLLTEEDVPHRPGDLERKPADAIRQPSGPATALGWLDEAAPPFPVRPGHSPRPATEQQQPRAVDLVGEQRGVYPADLVAAV